MMNLDNHPCFSKKACKSFGRVHLPVAPACNIQCNFCNRKFDCVNESRPGVTSSILTPDQAMNYLAEVVEAKPNTTVVGIAGPGDPFANPVQTMDTLRKVRAAYPDMMLCVATNGLGVGPYIDELAELNVSHVTVTVNAVDPAIGQKIYAWVRDNKQTRGPEIGAKLLLERQLDAIKRLVEKGILVKINSIVIPGINEYHIEEVARVVGEMGVTIFNCMAYYPNEGAHFADLPEPSAGTMKNIRKKASAHVEQMTHCKRCRADAVGLLDDPLNQHLMERLHHHAHAPIPFPVAPGKVKVPANIKEPERTLVAIASREGVLVNQHLGESETLLIYDISGDTPVMVEKRKMPQPGCGDFRWYGVAKELKDCHTLLLSGIGERPKSILRDEGMTILEINGMIDMVLPALKANEDLSHLQVRELKCKEGCQGTGTGCM